MKITVQVVLHADDDTETVVREAFTVLRGALAPETLGLQLEEAKDLLAAVQDTVVEHQAAAALSAQAACPDCGIPHRHKDSRRIVVRTLFGVLRLDSPRWWSCPCT
ncbi:MAG TPA: ISKra4 family transposase, partial [Nakamurella sp.]|nr:ISKra4 family transposase [Nakamurella sp.]